MSLESQIDELYRGPLNRFTAARGALAKTLHAADAARVRALGKPTATAAAVNHVYWQARTVYERLLKSGERLRQAQISILKGGQADVRAVGDAHRRALQDAVHEAQRLTAAEGSRPGPDALMRTFEALSVAAGPSMPAHGRLTRELQPAGFEALAGVTPKELPKAVGERPAKRRAAGAAPTVDRAGLRRAAAAARRRDRALKNAQAQLARAQKTEAAARAAWERATNGVERARQAVDLIAGTTIWRKSS